MPSGSAALDLGDLLAHRGGHGDGVGAALLEHAERLERHAVEPRDRVDVLEAVLDERHVLEVDRARSFDAAHDELAERVEIERLAEQAHVELAPAGVELAAGDLDVLAADGVDDVAGDDALLGERLGVEPDAHVAIEVAVERDLPDAGHRLELLLHLVARDVGEQLPRERAGDADGEDGRVVGVRLGHRGGGHVLRERALRLRDLGLHVLQREIDVARDVEGGGDARDALARLRRRSTGRPRPARWPARSARGSRARPRTARRRASETLTRDVGVVDVRVLADADARERPRGRRASCTPSASRRRPGS